MSDPFQSLIENTSGLSQGVPLEHEILASIAISLKRIADSMERIALAEGYVPQDKEATAPAGMVIKSVWSPSKSLNGMDLWVAGHDGLPRKIEDRASFVDAIEKSVSFVAAFFRNDAKKLLDDPKHSSGEPVTFEFESASFTIPSNPIPF